MQHVLKKLLVNFSDVDNQNSSKYFRSLLYFPNTVAFYSQIFVLTLIRMGLFGLLMKGGAKKPPSPKICRTCPKKVKLGTVVACLRKVKKKNINPVKHPVPSAEINIFSPKISNFSYINKIDCISGKYRLYFNTQFHILLNFFGSLKVVLINVVAIMMISAKLHTLGLPKTRVFWSKGCDTIIFVRDITNKSFIMWLKLYFRCGHVTKVW